MALGAWVTVYLRRTAEQECLRKLSNVSGGAVGSEERCNCSSFVYSHSLGELLAVGPR